MDEAYKTLTQMRAGKLTAGLSRRRVRTSYCATAAMPDKAPFLIKRGHVGMRP